MITTTETVVAIEPPEPDAEQVERFARGIFKHATVGGYVSIRAFIQEEDNGRALFIRTFEITADLKYLVKGAINNALEAAKCGSVFSPPACTFTTYRYAYEKDVAEGLVLSVDSDKSYPRKALETLTALLGPPTFVVASGGRWLNSDTGELEDKLHLHWRLAVPARDVEALKKLKHARKLAAVIVGADTSNIPINHPIRWPGSWHLKAEPRLCRIIEDHDTEIDLGAAFDALQAVAPAEADVTEPSFAREVVDFEKAPKANKERNQYQLYAAEVAQGGKNSGRINTDMLVELMPYVPNPDFEYGDWNAHGMAIWRAVGAKESQEQFDLGLKLFDDFSKKSAAKYDAKKTAMRWYAYWYSPPNRTGGGKLIKIASQNGWKTAPTHAAVKGVSIGDARAMTRRRVLAFLYPNFYQWFGEKVRWLYQLGDKVGVPTVIAARIPTGVGKSTAAIEALAKFDPEVYYATSGIDPELQKSERLTGLFHYGVSTHNLADEIGDKMEAAGLNVRVARGRARHDPDSPGELMCLDHEKVEVALDENAPVAESCCKKGDDVCPFYEQCGYQQQWRDTEALQGWVFPHDFLFIRNEAMGEADVVILDESFWDKQIKGVESGEIVLPLDFAGKDLAQILDRQEDDGPLRLSLFTGNTNTQPLDGQEDGSLADDNIDLLNALISEIWSLKPDIPYHPSMNAKQLKKHLKAYSGDLKTIARIHLCDTVLKEIREMIWNDIYVSGRLRIGRDKDDVRVIKWRGVKPIVDQFKRRTLILDAMLPGVEILRVSHPQVTVIPNIEVEHDPAAVQVRQVTGAPTSKKKLAVEKHAKSLRRYILRRWAETGRQRTLVVTNKAFEEVLSGTLPDNISLAHFNAVAGLDSFGDVRLLIVIGRPVPRPSSCESKAAALSGKHPQCINDDIEDDETWYPSIKRGIRLRDGTGVAVRADQHPDSLCEEIRSQACEAEVMQAIGRGRGVNRTPDTPLDIDIVNDLALPITVDQHIIWDGDVRHVTTAIEDGVMLESPEHMVKLWPTLWPNEKNAKRALQDEGLPTMPGFQRFQYKMKSRGAKWRYAWFDITRIPAPAGWIESRLGPATVEACP